MPQVTLMSNDTLVENLKKIIEKHKLMRPSCHLLQRLFWQNHSLVLSNEEISMLMNDLYGNQLIVLGYVGNCDPKHFCYIDHARNLVYFTDPADAINYKLMVL